MTATVDLGDHHRDARRPTPEERALLCPLLLHGDETIGASGLVRLALAIAELRDRVVRGHVGVAVVHTG